MCAVIVAMFVTPAPQQVIGESSRIFYFHVPQAWVSVLAFALAMVFSVRYLRSRQPADDDRARTAAALGLMFCLLATITGSLFARVYWGSFWNWDPREMSIFVLLLIYFAYFALRGAIEVEERRAALSAVYAVFAFVTVPLLVFVLPRMVPGLHPGANVANEDAAFSMSPTVAVIFFPALAVFTVLFVWIFTLASRIQALSRADEEKDM